MLNYITLDTPKTSTDWFTFFSKSVWPTMIKAIGYLIISIAQTTSRTDWGWSCLYCLCNDAFPQVDIHNSDSGCLEIKSDRGVRRARRLRCSVYSILLCPRGGLLCHEITITLHYDNFLVLWSHCHKRKLRKVHSSAETQYHRDHGRITSDKNPAILTFAKYKHLSYWKFEILHRSPFANWHTGAGKQSYTSSRLLYQGPDFSCPGTGSTEPAELGPLANWYSFGNRLCFQVSNLSWGRCWYLCARHWSECATHRPCWSSNECSIICRWRHRCKWLKRPWHLCSRDMLW